MDDTIFAALPHHKLIAFEVARDLLLAVRACSLRDAKLRGEATRSAKATCLNTAEVAHRPGHASDKARAFAIARAETRRSRRGVEIALLCGDCGAPEAEAVARIAADTTSVMALRLLDQLPRHPIVGIAARPLGAARGTRQQALARRGSIAPGGRIPESVETSGPIAHQMGFVQQQQRPTMGRHRLLGAGNQPLPESRQGRFGGVGGRIDRPLAGLLWPSRQFPAGGWSCPPASARPGAESDLAQAQRAGG